MEETKMSHEQLAREIDPTFFELLYPLVNESITKKRKVLLVENDVETATTLESLFAEDKDIDLQVVNDPDEAMLLLIQHKFDLVVLEDHHHSPTLHHTGYIYKANDTDSIALDIKRYFLTH